MRFYIGEEKGLYTLLEALAEEYVFYRSFPNYDPENYALFKVKTLSLGRLGADVTLTSSLRRHGCESMKRRRHRMPLSEENTGTKLQY